MGLYINPTEETKEEWLAVNTIQIQGIGVPDKMQVEALITSGIIDFKTNFPICLIDNGLFKAAGVGYNETEIMRFMQEDGRSKEYCVVDRDKLLDVCPEASDYIK